MSADQAPTVGTLSDLLVARLHRLMPPGPRLDRLTAELTDTFAGQREPVDEAGCRTVQDVANRHCRHLELHFDAAGPARPDAEPRGWPRPIRQRCGAGPRASPRYGDTTAPAS